MMKIDRPDAPDWLESHWERWGQEYLDKLNANSKYQFRWKQYEGVKVNRRLMPILKEMTQEHCAFCDAFPMGAMLEETIEHFRPKSVFPLLAYQWENLFISCRNCQRKSDNFDELLLKPDELAYSFERYFLFNFKTFEIEPNPKDSDDKARAEKTIELYRLNEFGRPAARRRAFLMYDNMKEASRIVEDFPFRYMFFY